MKLVYSLLILAVLGCNSNNLKVESNENLNKADSILNQNKQSLITADSTSKKSDSSIAKKVESTVKQMTTLKQENQQLKKENHALKIQLSDPIDTGKPFKLLPVSGN